MVGATEDLPHCRKLVYLFGTFTEPLLVVLIVFAQLIDIALARQKDSAFLTQLQVYHLLSISTRHSCESLVHLLSQRPYQEGSPST